MPGYDTHYLFGIKSYNEIPDSKVKESIKRGKDAYILGMLGPDIFFFYATEVVAVRKNIGSVMHTQKTDLFLKSMIDYVAKLNDNKNTIEIAYLCGFLSHYILDGLCHPFVYWRTDYLHKKKDYLEKHYQYESDIDIALLRIMRNVTPYEFLKASQITIDGKNIDRVCKMLYYAIHQTYDCSRITHRGIRYAILSIKKEQQMLKILSNKVKNAVEKVEKVFIGQSYLAALIPGGDKERSDDPLNLRHDEWRNPWDTNIKSNNSVPEMMDKGSKKFVIMTHLLEDYLFEFKRDDKAYNMLLRTIGNASYHSGLSCKKPS